MIYIKGNGTDRYIYSKLSTAETVCETKYTALGWIEATADVIAKFDARLLRWSSDFSSVEETPEDDLEKIRQQELIDAKENELVILRNLRNNECFAIINRGELWYDTLTDEQRADLATWYAAWLDVTETKVIPAKPSWLD